MRGIIEINIKRIVKYSFGFLKRNTMLWQVSGSFYFIPFTLHRIIVSPVSRRGLTAIEASTIKIGDFLWSVKPKLPVVRAPNQLQPLSSNLDTLNPATILDKSQDLQRSRREANN
jgi:hypothetical protein